MDALTKAIEAEQARRPQVGGDAYTDSLFSMIEAAERLNEAKHGPNWPTVMHNEWCWNHFRLIFAAGTAICVVLWLYTHLVLISLPAWSLLALLFIPAALGWLEALRHLK